MNVERWYKTRRPTWESLEALLRTVEASGLRSLNHQQLQELGRLYRMASSDLSAARAKQLGQNVQVYLNNLVVKAHNQVYQNKANRWVKLMEFLWVGFPALVRHHIVYVAAAFAIVAAPACLGYTLARQDTDFAQMEIIKGRPLIAEDMWHIIEQHKMWTDETQHCSVAAASMIATNNMRVAIMAFILGITFGFGTVLVLCINGLSIGTIFGVCRHYGLAGNLLAFAAPHGVLELTAIFISGGAGLMLGKSLLFPGQYKRLDAFKMVAGDAGGLFGGCIPILLIAGSIEGFISPRTDMSFDAKYLISLATLFCLVLYLFLPHNLLARASKQ